MKDVDQTHLESIREAKTGVDAGSPLNPVSIRVSPHGYVTVLLLTTFLSALFFYLEIDPAGFALFALSWIVVPFLAFRDRIVFDGKRLERTGWAPRTWAWYNRSRQRLKISDIEQVETQAVRAAKRGGNVYYRYRTSFRGRGLNVTAASGGEEYRQMMRSILPLLTDDVLDIRSIELRDHLNEPKEVLTKAEFARIPSADVLESTLPIVQKGRPPASEGPQSIENEERAEDLQALANELRLSGYLLQALEAFRRALVLRPRDARLIFDFARCLHSFAGVSRNRKLERKAIAALRLSEKRADADSDLLNKLAETYFQIGEWRRAGSIFQRVLDKFGENFAAARGLAELALREGKIAHVIHHFGAANRVAATPALRRWTRNETDYFSRLSADDEYLEMEISRVNLLETLETFKRTGLRIAFVAFPLITVGLIFDDSIVANIGWAISSVTLLVWAGLTVMARMLSRRIPYELVSDDNDH